MPNRTGYNLYILKEQWGYSGTGLEQAAYSLTRDESWALLRTIDLSDPAMTLTESDIVVYNWPQQVIVLTSEASQRLHQVFPGDFLSLEMDSHVFVITLNGKRLYGGMVEDAMSQLAIHFPTILVPYWSGWNGQPVDLWIRPTSWQFTPFRCLGEQQDWVALPEIAAFFATQGTLSYELGEDPRFIPDAPEDWFGCETPRPPPML